MAVKTVLVCLNERRHIKQLIAAAVSVARTFDAHISGLYVIPAAQIYPSVGFEAAPLLFEGNRFYFRQHAQEVRDQFEAEMQSHSLRFDMHIVDSRSPLIAEEIIVHGRSADVLIVAATDKEGTSGVERDFVQQITMSIGRPVIVLPDKGKMALKFNQILVGWDNGREAARAVFDALPFLAKADLVRLQRADPQKDPGLRHSNLPDADIAATLSRHGVKLTIEAFPIDSTKVGAALLDHARQNDADLLVMGAYGHSRLTEYIFGGATHHVLAHHDLPILIAH